MKNLPVLLALVLLSAAGCVPRRTALAVAELRCEFDRDPLGVDVSQPRLSWLLQSGEQGQSQTAYQVLAASDPALLAREEGDLWDSGKVASDATLGVAYAGQALSSARQVFWKVRAWDRRGRPSAWSSVASWTMGLLAEAASASARPAGALSVEPAGPAGSNPPGTAGSTTQGGSTPGAPPSLRRFGAASWITDPDLFRWQRALLGYRSEDAADADTTKWVQIDLGASRTIDAVRLDAVRCAVVEDTGFPERFKV